jgi:hypothetical protein
MNRPQFSEGSAAAGEMQLLLHYMPILVRAPGLSDWERTFCASITARRRGGAVRWSGKQIATMRRLVARFRAAAVDDPVIEGGADHG